jgi:hypothetical protein
MFTPKLSAAQRRAVTGLRTRLASALKPVVVDEPPELARLIAKRDELRTDISGIERNDGGSTLEERALALTNRRAQRHLVEIQIKELRGSHEKAAAVAHKESAETLAALSDEARNVLADVAKDFHDQHRTAFEDASSQYATTPTQASQLVNLFPAFLRYLRAIRQFRETGADPERLLQWLGEALDRRDFLMLPGS